MRHPYITLVKLPLAIVLALGLSACSEPAPEEKLAAAGENVEDAEERLATLDEQIAHHESVLDELLSERRAARDELRTLEQRLAARASDVAVFRAIQTALLNDPSLNDAAIQVDVNDGAVTLRGLATAEQSAHAREVAKSTPGVDEVRSRLQIESTQ